MCCASHVFSVHCSGELHSEMLQGQLLCGFITTHQVIVLHNNIILGINAQMITSVIQLSKLLICL